MSFENRIITKRLKKKEIPLILEKYKDCNITITETEEKNSGFCAEVCFKHLKFKIPNSYPFKPPKLFVNNIDYQSMLCINNKEINKELKNRNIPCLCCNSILCHWSPIYKIIDLIDEFYTIKKIIFNSRAKMLLEKICIKNNIYFENIVKKIISFL